MQKELRDSLTMELAAELLLHAEVVARQVGLAPIDVGGALMLAMGCLSGTGKYPTPEAALEQILSIGRPLFIAGFKLARAGLKPGQG
jgi:hypothetical protein